MRVCVMETVPEVETALAPWELPGAVDALSRESPVSTSNGHFLNGTKEKFDEK